MVNTTVRYIIHNTGTHNINHMYFRTNGNYSEAYICWYRGSWSLFILDSTLQETVLGQSRRAMVSLLCISIVHILTILHSEEFFYQLGLIQFGNFNRVKLEPAPSLRKLVTLAVNAEEGTKHSKLSKEEIVEVSRSYCS